MTRVQGVGNSMKTADSIVELFRAIEPKLRERAEEIAREEVARWRNGVVTLTNWCCTDMAGFASESFGMSRPQSDATYQTYLEWRGRRMRYCPFCGVHFTVREK
jgi:hypothetical protein